VGLYLKRIDAYDKNGPGINAIVVVNPEVEKRLVADHPDVTSSRGKEPQLR
jgi:hypothetical protein